MRDARPSPGRQRGAFAVLATVLLLAVVAVGITLLLRSTQTGIYAGSVANQSLQALAAAESGLEVAFARLDKLPFDPSVCNVVQAVEGAVGAGTYRYTMTELFDPFEVEEACNVNGGARGCRILSVGVVGASTRTITADISYCTPVDRGGAMGLGGASCPIEQTTSTWRDGSMVVSKMAYNRTASTGEQNPSGGCQVTEMGGGQAKYGNYNIQPANGATPQLDWDTTSSSGLVSVAGAGAHVTAPTAGDYKFFHTLVTQQGQTLAPRDRRYASVGAVFEPREGLGAVTFIGRYPRPSDDTTTVTNNSASGGSATGSVLDGRGAGNWCDGADTLVLGFAAKDGGPTTRLTGAWFGSTANTFKELQRQTSGSDGVYAQIWYIHRPNNGIADLFTAPNTSFGMVFPGSTPQWIAGFTCLTGVDPASPRGLGFYLQMAQWAEPY